MSTDDPSGSLVVTRELAAEPETVFAMWTDPEQPVHWWGPAHVTCTGASIDLRVGGRIRLENQLDSGELIVISGVFTEVQPPHLLRHTWTTDGEGHSDVTITFEASGRGTLVRVLHERVATADFAGLSRWLSCPAAGAVGRPATARAPAAGPLPARW